MREPHGNGRKEHACVVAAARPVQPGDRVILMTSADLDEAELAGYEPTVVHVDTANRQVPEDLAGEFAGERRYVDVPA